MPGSSERIPLHTVLSLILTAAVTAHISVLDRHNETFERLEDEPARFGPNPSQIGTWGYLMVAEPNNGCSKMKAAPNDSTPYIALIKRNDCNFDLKVLNAQKAGYSAAIVRNVGDDRLIPMQGGKYSSGVDIVSVFISEKDGLWLENLIAKKPGFSLLIQDLIPLDPEIYLIPFAIVVGICFIVMVVFVVVKWILSVRRKRRSRLSKANLNKIPVKKFKKGDPYDICAVCLDEYEDGEKLRILPCNHAYHQKCIDPWLTKNKRTCPLCKKKVIPGEPDTSSSEEESDHESGANSETAPLLGGPSRGRGRNPRRTTGNTFDASGLPDALRGAAHRMPDTDTSSYASSSEDSVEPSTSMYQSSVEVHGSNPARHESAHIDPTQGSSPSSSDFRALIQPVMTANQDSRSRSSSSGMEEGAVGGVGENPTFELVEDHFTASAPGTSAGNDARQLPLLVQFIGNIQDGEDEIDRSHDRLLPV